MKPEFTLKFFIPLLLGVAIVVVSIAAAAPKKGSKVSEPIVQLKDIQPERHSFKKGGFAAIEVTSDKQLTSYFSAKVASQLKKQVDFKKQVLVLFAWQGSGKDQLDYVVAESYPEQIKFNYQRGRTKDLRPHSRVYLLRKNVSYKLNK